MDRGPVTFVILKSDDDAIKRWRETIGTHYDINVLRVQQPGSLRARFALSNHNNLWHGSGNPDDVKTELGLLTKFLSSRISLP